MRVLRAAVVLGVSTPLVVLGCGADDGTARQPAVGGEGGEAIGASGASGAGAAGSPIGGDSSQGGSPSVDGGSPSGGTPDMAGQPTGGAGGAPSEPEPVCGDAQADGALVCFGAPQPLSLVEGSPLDMAIGEWDALEGRDLIVASNGGLRYFSNTAGVLETETYVGAAGTVLAAGQLSSEGDLDLLLGQADNSTVVAFGGGDGLVSASETGTFGYEGQLYNYSVADVAGTGPSQDFVVTYGSTVTVVITSGNEGEGFQTHFDSVYPQSPLDSVLAKLGSSQWLVYSSQGNLERRLVTYDLGAVTVADEAEPVTAVGGSPAQLDLGDFNEDGFSDVAATLTDSGDVSVLFGDGTEAGDFALVEDEKRFLTLTIGTSDQAKTQRDVKVGDFTGDGHADLAVSVHGLDAVAIFAGDGQGAFSAPELLNTGAGSGPARLAVGDLNDDGVDDLAVLGETSSKVIVLLSNP
ncbi:MAG: VCBS repeat-containing protein [Myxococcales bacterium]|nr:MAG: VCBS repeat-containing protein [Myxococcales bacterium]